MSSQSYNLYYKDCLDFVRTIIIKSEQTAQAVFQADYNDLLVRQAAGLPLYPNDEYDKTTWRYYMNLAGIPHPTLYKFNKAINDFEFIIKVVSLDTHEIIDFTIDNLKIHRATAREYRIGSAYYQKLIDKYPEHLDYIRGVIQPVDIQYAIEANNNTILAWDERYVEDNEYSLMTRLQRYVDRFYTRWSNEDYCLTDDLYHATRIGILYIYLPFAVMNIRYDLSRSIEAHTFHVWNYLASHQHLDEYRAYMSMYQRLWFYRNIRWIETNPGKMETFRKLIQNVMTVRNLPLSEFHVIHKTKNMKDNPDQFYPENVWLKDPLNFHDSQTRDGEERSTRKMMEQNATESRDNNKDFENHYKETNDGFNRSPNNKQPSKVLESRTTDYTKISPIKKQHVDVDEWIYMASHDLYVANIIIEDPNSSNVFNFNMKQAVITYIYAIMKAYNLIPNNKKCLIPTIAVRKVLKYNRPTIEEVSKVISRGITEIKYVHALDEYTPPVTKIIGTERFSEFCQEVYDCKMLHRNIYSFTNEIKLHGQVKNASEMYFESVVCTLAEPGTYFEDYFKANGFKFNHYSREHWVKLSEDLIKYSLGYDLKTRLSIADIQGMMVRLLKQLSSYTVQFMKHIEDDEVNSIDMPYMRYSKIKAYSQAEVFLPIDVDVSNAYVTGYHRNNEVIDIGVEKIETAKIKGVHRESSELLLTIDPKGKIIIRNYVEMPRFDTINVTVKRKGKTINPVAKSAWNLDKFRIHNTTEDRSRVVEDEEGNLIIRGVVYVDKNYNGGNK